MSRYVLQLRSEFGNGLASGTDIESNFPMEGALAWAGSFRGADPTIRRSAYVKDLDTGEVVFAASRWTPPRGGTQQ